MTSYKLANQLTSFSPVIGVILLASVIVAFWQHEASMDDMMRRMMGPPMFNMMLWMYFPIILVSILLIVMPLIFHPHPKTATAEMIGLTEEEKNVVEFLKANRGMAEQRDISKSLGLTRLKTHRIVSSLRKRGVVEVKPHGRTNVVMLKNIREAA